jgi:hypothetical protein
VAIERPVASAADTSEGMTLVEVEELIREVRNQGAPDDARFRVAVVMSLKSFSTRAPIREAQVEW